MSWTDWAQLALNLYDKYQGDKSNNKATGASIDAENKRLEELRRQFDLTRSDNMPWLNAGKDALGGLQKLMGGDYSGFYNSPDYKYALDQGVTTMDRGAAARGGLYSGGHSADLMKFGQGLATQNLGNYRGSLQEMAGLGQHTATNLGQFGENYAQNVGQGYRGIADARRTSYGNNAYNNSAFASNLADIFNNWGKG